MLKKVLKILLIIFIVLAVIVSALTIWQWKNIQSILLGLRADSGEIQRLRDENQTKLVGDVNEFMDIPLREMTEEEKAQIESGEATVNEIYQKIFEEKIEEEKKKEQEKAPEENNDKQPQNSGEEEKKPSQPEKEKIEKDNKPAEEKPAKDENTKPSAEPAKPDKDLLISEAMVDLYALQNEFNARAEATIRQGDSYYMSIRKHPQDAEARSQTISHFTPIVRGIESECDKKVEAVVVKLENDLKSIGADTSITETIRTTYANEKQLKLSYYTNKYLK